MNARSKPPVTVNDSTAFAAEQILLAQEQQPKKKELQEKQRRLLKILNEPTSAGQLVG
jgi:hypothetical protein